MKKVIFGMVLILGTSFAHAGNVVFQGNAGTVTSVTGNNGVTVQTGTTTPVISVSSVSLSTQIIGNLPVTNLNSGTNATSSTYWRGDGTWVSSSTFGGSGVTGSGTTGQLSKWSSSSAIGNATAGTDYMRPYQFIEVSSNTGGSTTNSVESVVAYSGSLPALAAGKCWKYDVIIFDISGSNTTNDYSVWVSSSVAALLATQTSGTKLTSGPDSNNAPVNIYGTVCNNAGVQNAQTFSMFPNFSNTAGGFSYGTTLASDLTQTNWQIVITVNTATGGNQYLIQRFSVELDN